MGLMFFGKSYLMTEVAAHFHIWHTEKSIWKLLNHCVSSLRMNKTDDLLNQEKPV